MKFNVNRTVFLENLQICGRASSTRTNVPALEGILLEAEGNSLSLSGYDMEISVRSVIDADVLVPGSIVINTRMLLDIVRRLSYDTMTVEVDDQMNVSIRSGVSVLDIKGTPGDEFPLMPDLSGKASSFQIEAFKLRSMIRQTSYAVAISDNKPVHTGCLFEQEGNSLTVVAVDGYRLAIRKEELTTVPSNPLPSFVVPGRALTELSRVLDESEEEVQVELTNRQILFRIGTITMGSRLLEGEFIAYRNAIPKESRFIFTVPVKIFIESMERASLMVSEHAKAPVILEFGFDVIKISCTTTLGRIYDEVPIQGQGEPLIMGFNNRYLLDALKACEREEVRIELGTPVTPMVIKPSPKEDPEQPEAFSFLVLPVHLKR
jgi:DNA polymerase-3 subunit beta